MFVWTCGGESTLNYRQSVIADCKELLKKPLWKVAREFGSEGFETVTRAHISYIWYAVVKKDMPYINITHMTHLWLTSSLPENAKVKHMRARVEEAFKVRGNLQTKLPSRIAAGGVRSRREIRFHNLTPSVLGYHADRSHGFTCFSDFVFAFCQWVLTEAHLHMHSTYHIMREFRILDPTWLCFEAYNELTFIEGLLAQIDDDEMPLTSLGFFVDLQLRAALARAHVRLFCRRSEDTEAIEAEQAFKIFEARSLWSHSAEHSEGGEGSEGGDGEASEASASLRTPSIEQLAQSFVDSLVSADTVRFILKQLHQPCSLSSGEARLALVAILSGPIDDSISAWLERVAPGCTTTFQSNQDVLDALNSSSLSDAGSTTAFNETLRAAFTDAAAANDYSNDLCNDEFNEQLQGMLSANMDV